MKDFSLQLYSLRDVEDFQQRLEIAAKAGYTGIEFAGYGDLPAAELKQRMAALGLRATGSHIAYEALRDDLDGCIRYCVEAGITSAACPWYDLKTREQALELAQFLENCAVKFAQAGITFAYHNHAHEFAADGGETLLEAMIANTEKLGFELDVYWVAFAGQDPVEFIRKHAGRFPLLHFKEINADKENVELGRGVQDFPKLVEVGLAQGVQEFVVEQEHYTMEPADSVTVGAAYMKTL